MKKKNRFWPKNTWLFLEISCCLLLAKKIVFFSVPWPGSKQSWRPCCPGNSWDTPHTAGRVLPSHTQPPGAGPQLRNLRSTHMALTVPLASLGDFICASAEPSLDTDCDFCWEWIYKNGINCYILSQVCQQPELPSITFRNSAQILWCLNTSS